MAAPVGFGVKPEIYVSSDPDGGSVTVRIGKRTHVHRLRAGLNERGMCMEVGRALGEAMSSFLPGGSVNEGDQVRNQVDWLMSALLEVKYD